MTSEGFASKSAEKVSEQVLARVLSQVVETYALNSGPTCRLYMPVTTKDGGLSFGTGHSDGGCGE
jgi:hypothetical protein